MRLFLKLSYNGTAFHGWQRQPGLTTVQETVETALSTVLDRKVACHGCGRTDSGVHAKLFYVHLDADEIEVRKLLYRANKLVGENILLTNLLKVPKNANAQRDAIARTYQYHLHTFKNPFIFHKSTWFPVDKIDFALLQDAASQLTQFSDFSAYCKTPDRHLSTICHISEVKWKQNSPDNLEFRITADHFLRGMIRLLVGNMLEVASGNISIQSFTDCLRNNTQPKFFQQAPPQGLHLVNVTYPYQLENYSIES